MQVKILIFSRDPGGANTVIPLAKPLEERGYKVRLFGKDTALEKYLKANLSGLNIMDFVKDTNLENLEEFLAKENPNFIITGTSFDFTERYIWKSAEKLKIPSFAILDQWLNYGIRFSKYSSSEIGEYNNNKTFPYLPSKIMVMDDYAKQEAIKDGLDSSRIIVTGQPYFETLLKEKGKLLPEKIKELNDKLSIGEGDYTITFAGEPISKDYNKLDNSGHYWGYTEQTVFKEILESVKIISNEHKKNFSIIVKLHPREDINNYADIISLFKGEKINIIVDKDSNSWDLIFASDLICGMSSMFLMESVILEKPTISVQIGLSRENPFVLDRRGILKSVTDKNTLMECLESIIVENNFLSCKFDFIKNPTNNIIFQMEKYLCQN